MSRILRLEPASQPQNLRAEPEKLEQVTYRSKQRGDNIVVAAGDTVHKTYRRDFIKKTLR